MKIKHCFQRFAAVMACLMLGMFCLPGAAHAAGYVQLTKDQLDAKCTRTLEYPLAYTTFRLYKVAEVDRDVQYTITPEFAGYNAFVVDKDGVIQVEGDAREIYLGAPNTLAGYVARDSAELEPAATIVTGSVVNGKAAATASGLSTGLYLVVGEQGSQNGTTYTPAAFLAELPAWDNSAWNFDVSADAKYTTYTPSGGGGDSTITRRVLKIWEDDGFEDERPSQITVDLLRDGQVYDTAVLSAGNNWRASWSGLSPNYDWQLAEREGEENYVVSVALDGITFTVTNTYVEDLEDIDPPLAEKPDNPGDGGTDLGDGDVPLDGGDPGDELIDIEDDDPPLADLPQTGQLWWPVPLLALAGAGLLALGLVKRGKQSD